ncbi:MAG: alanine-zipper protein [Pseudomonadota bacterium]|nr:alanine-zipper protein [Pseudomonadota bacterium]
MDNSTTFVNQQREPTRQVTSTVKEGDPMKNAMTKTGLATMALALVLMTGCATNARVDAVEAKADAAQAAADAAMAAAQRAQQTADQALRAANDANAAVTRLSETVGRK